MPKRSFNRRTFSLLLLIAALVSIGYALYRSTDVRVTIAGAGTETIYGEPQHGLLLGMCIFAGMCVLGIVLLFRDTPVEEIKEVNKEQPKPYTRTATNYPQ